MIDKSKEWVLAGISKAFTLMPMDIWNFTRFNTNVSELISIEMVCLYHFLELFTGKYFLKRNLLILFLIYFKIINSAQ